MHESKKWKWSRSVVSDPQRPHGLQPSRVLRPWDFPGKSTGVECHCLLRENHLLLLYWLCQSLWLYGSKLTVENSSRDRNTRPPDLPLEKPVCRSGATVRTRHGTTDWFQIRKGVRQGCILSPSLFNLYAEYIMRNAGLEEAQAGIKIAGRNINNLTHADDTTLMAESKEELKSLLMNMKEESEKVGLKLNIQKAKIMASGLITSWQIDGKAMETLTDYFLGLQNHCRWWLQPWH